MLPATSISGRTSVSDQFHELARIFAAGVLRLQKQRLLAGDPPVEKPPESTATGLEVPAPTVLSVHAG